MSAPALATVVGFGGALIGIWMTGAHRRSRVILPFSAGVLLGVVLFGVAPEMVHEAGWGMAALLFRARLRTAAGDQPFRLSGVSHLRARSQPQRLLERTAARLRRAADRGDGAAQLSWTGGAWRRCSRWRRWGCAWRCRWRWGCTSCRRALAIGAILLAAVKSRSAAVGWSAVAQGTTLIGGAVGLALAPHLGSEWTTVSAGDRSRLARLPGLTDAVHEEVRRRGALAASLAAGAGLVVAALVQRGAEALPAVDAPAAGRDIFGTSYCKAHGVLLVSTYSGN